LAVSQFVKLLATNVGLYRDEVICASIGGYLHDLGKVGILDSILLGKGCLADKEFEIVKTHPLIETRLVAEHPIRPIFDKHVRHHHEPVDGTGSQETGKYSLGFVDQFNAKDGHQRPSFEWNLFFA